MSVANEWSDRPALARVYDALGSSDSAIAVDERYVGARSLSRTTLDAFELGHALERLGALYDKRGDRARAGEYYARWADLWRGADPSLRRRDVGGASSRTLGRTGESVASSRRLIGDASSARRLSAAVLTFPLSSIRMLN